MSRAYYERYWSTDGFNPPGDLSPDVARLLDSLAPSRIVDIGCGDGGAAGAWALERKVAYLGYDVAQSALEQARGRGLTVAHIEDASCLPLPDASEALLTCLEVFEHLVDPLSAAKEMRRVLRPNGQLLATVPNAAYWVRRVELGLIGRFHPYGDNLSLAEPWRDPHLRFFTRGSLRAMLGRAGFARVAVHGAVQPPFSRRAAIEGSAPYAWALHRWPALLAPTLLVIAR